MNYYNEIDPKAAAWIWELIAAGLIPKGEVDERSIIDVQPGDLRGYRQCHFFCGIAGWSLALKLAGWPEDREVWTGSCPCQPFSCAGRQQGAADDRNLWPPFMRLIRERKPQCVFGEQVEAALRSNWFDRVSADLETEAYAVGAVVLGAHSVGAPHIRQRLYWMAYAGYAGQQRRRLTMRSEAVGKIFNDGNGDRRTAYRLAVSQLSERWPQHVNGQDGCDGQDGGRTEAHCESGTCGQVCGHVELGEQGGGMAYTESVRRQKVDVLLSQQMPGARLQGRFWDNSTWYQCRDGKQRRIPTQSALFPLAARLPGRVGLLRGAGNAICAPLAAGFIQAATEAIMMCQKPLEL